MRFRNGFWHLDGNVTLYSHKAYFETDARDNKLSLYAASYPITCRNDTLNNPVITTEIYPVAENILRVDVYHHKGAVEEKPFPAITSTFRGIVGDNSITSGNLKAEYADGTLVFSYKGNKLTKRFSRLSGCMTTPDGRFMAEYLNTDIGENYYGLGERFTSFVKNGQKVEMWNLDSGCSSEMSHKNIPFFISSKNYGIFVLSYSKVSFEMGSEVTECAQFSVPGEKLSYCIIAGDTLKDVVSGYTKITGRPALPPKWSFGLWLSTSFTTDYSEKTVLSFVDRMAKENIPLSVMHFDCFWMKGFQWVDFTWDPEMFPDPVSMLRKLHDRGLHVSVWINPYVAQKSPLFDEGASKGYFLRRKDGNVWQCDVWQAGMAIVDFTNPAAVKWYQDKLRKLVEMGVDCFKTDFGENIPVDDVVWYDGSDPALMHNRYTYIYNEAVFSLLKEMKGDDAMVFTRSATIGSQTMPVHWAGDNVATYSSMASTLRGGLSLALSGFGFWSHDIGGFEDTTSPDLFKRWVAFGLLSSHSRLHGSSSYRVPWAFDEEACRVTEFFTNLKKSLLPYLWKYAEESHNTGIPILRPLLLEFGTGDEMIRYIDKEYMLGPSLLVAPVMKENGECSFYLPEGRWISILDGTSAEGPCWIRKNYDFFSLPLYARENSIIPMEKDGKHILYAYNVSEAELEGIAEIKNGECILHDDNYSELVVTVSEGNSSSSKTISIRKGSNVL